MASAPPAAERQPTTIKVNGEERTVSHEELIALAQKGTAADEKFREAAALKAEVAHLVEQDEDLRALAETGDPEAFRRAGASLGLTEEQIAEAEKIVYEEMDPDLEEYQEGTGGGQQVGAAAELAQLKAELENREVDFASLSPDVRNALLHVEDQRISGIVQKAVDSDETLSYYMKSYDEKGQGAILKMIDDKIRGRLDDSNGQFGDGAEVLRTVLPEVKEVLEHIGAPNRSTPRMGLGPAPGGHGAGVYPTKEPDHVPSTDAGFEQSIADTIRFHASK